MRVSTVKTIFHITGGAIFILGGLLVIAGLDNQVEGSTIALLIGLCLIAASFYCFAGAPQITGRISRKFPDTEHRKKKPSKPHHGFKALVGIGYGILVTTFLLIDFFADLIPSHKREALTDVFLLATFAVPVLSIWGAAHLAWHKGHSPKIPLVVGATCFVISCAMSAIKNMELMFACGLMMTMLPALSVLFLGRRTSRRSR